jgi:hypothetical protein
MTLVVFVLNANIVITHALYITNSMIENILLSACYCNGFKRKTITKTRTKTNKTKQYTSQEKKVIPNHKYAPFLQSFTYKDNICDGVVSVSSLKYMYFFFSAFTLFKI